MSTVSKVVLPLASTHHLRPFDVRRDLVAVADLVEMCFAQTLDQDGRRYLQKMRRMAQNPGLLQWTALTSRWTSVPLSGYVWEQDGQVVGNASLIPYYMAGRRLYLIANVAVHPDYRRQGIARSLTAQAVKFAKKRGVPSVWLHVREDNDSAVKLYQDLGFIERARRTTWTNSAERVVSESPPGSRVGTVQLRHWKYQRAWLSRSYPKAFSWHLSFNLNLLNPGLLGGLLRLFYNAYVEQWAIMQNNRLLATVSWQSSSGYANDLWLAAPQNSPQEYVQALLSYVLERVSPGRPVALDYPARQFSQAIANAGFDERHTLIWMEKDLRA